MDIMELGAIGELAGGLAVIGSLIYVGLQVRQSNQLNRAESVRSFVRDHVALLQKIGDRDFADVFRKGSLDFDGLSKTDQTRVHVWLTAQFWLSFGNNLVDPQHMNPLTSISDEITAHIFRTRGFDQWWTAFKTGAVGTVARQHIERIDHLSQSPDVPNLDELPWFRPDEPIGKRS